MYGKSTRSFVETKRMPSIQQGIALLESLIAIVIFSIGILALVGLQSAMVNNTTGSKFRADASYIAQQKLGQLWADPANVTASTTDLSTLPNGKCVITIPGPGQVLIVVTWQQPGEAIHNVTTNARIMGGA